MGIVNIECPVCGEPMWVERIDEAMYDYFDGSWEVKRLFAFRSEGIVHIWQCMDCGHFEPICRGRVGPPSP